MRSSRAQGCSVVPQLAELREAQSRCRRDRKGSAGRRRRRGCSPTARREHATLDTRVRLPPSAPGFSGAAVCRGTRLSRKEALQVRLLTAAPEAFLPQRAQSTLRRTEGRSGRSSFDPFSVRSVASVANKECEGDFHRRDWEARSDNAYGCASDSVFVGSRHRYACHFPNPYRHRMRPVCHPVRRGGGGLSDRVIERLNNFQEVRWLAITISQ